MSPKSSYRFESVKISSIQLARADARKRSNKWNIKFVELVATPPHLYTASNRGMEILYGWALGACGKRYVLMTSGELLSVRDIV